jgi:hypothetical protein
VPTPDTQLRVQCQEGTFLVIVFWQWVYWTDEWTL